MRRGFLYLVAIMDWHSRRVLSWRLSNTLEAEFCADALDEAIARFGPPEIMNTDQSAQLTAFARTDRFRRARVRFSMDGKECFPDNIFIERLWRSLKYECVYLRVWGRPDSKPAPSCEAGSTSTTTGGLTPPSTDGRRTWSTAPARRSCNPTTAPGE
jgi:transposase InsO family protein